jgi:hypothetical protein
MDIADTKRYGHTWDSIFEHKAGAWVMVWYQGIFFSFIVVALGLRFAHSLFTMFKDETPSLTRYRLLEFRFFLTLGLDCLILTISCTVGCFQFKDYNNFYGAAVCRAAWHLPIELFLDVLAFVTILTVVLVGAVFLIFKRFCFKQEFTVKHKKVIGGVGLGLALALVIGMLVPVANYL